MAKIVEQMRYKAAILDIPSPGSHLLKVKGRIILENYMIVLHYFALWTTQLAPPPKFPTSLIVSYVVVS